MNRDTKPEEGKLINLRVPVIEEDCIRLSDWTLDSEWDRLLMAEPARPISIEDQHRWLEQMMKKDEVFIIERKDNQEPIGEIHISDIDPLSGNGNISVSLIRRCWDKGYGGEAIRLMMGYAFSDPRLSRLSLTVFAYNTRAIHVYQKAGFKMEGKQRKAINRDGRRWDLIYMGILKREWITLQHRNINA